MRNLIPKTPFATRLSGSAKETELRLRSIFQWQKKRPPVWLFTLIVLVIFSCIGLVSCQQEGEEAAQPEGFFAGYRDDFEAEAYKGVRTFTNEDRTLIYEDGPENVVESLVAYLYYCENLVAYDELLKHVGEGSFRLATQNAAEQADELYFDTVILHTLDTLSKDDFAPGGAYFADEKTAQRFVDELTAFVGENALTEYTVVYVDLSWLWSERALDMGPQLGNGRYERLYLVGKTAQDEGWKLYECFWGEYTLERMYSWERFALQLLESSLRYEDEVLSFTIPTPMQAGTGVQGAWDIQIAGRAVRDGIVGVSLHYLTEEQWEAGRTYTVDISTDDWQDMTELSMEARIEAEVHEIDVLTLIRKRLLRENRERLGMGRELIIDFFANEQLYNRAYFLGEEPGEPQEDDLRIDEVWYLGSEPTYETTGEAYMLRKSIYGTRSVTWASEPTTGWWPIEATHYLVLGRAADGELYEVRGDSYYLNDSVSQLILEKSYGVTDWEVALWHDDNPYPQPLAVGRWNENALSFLDGELSVEVLEGWEPIYWEGDYWNRCTLDGLSILRYYNSSQDRHVNYTIELTRDDFATRRGIRLGSSREEVKAAYPELKSGSYWAEYPGEDYLWYCDDELDFGPAILFFFENDKVSKIILNNMFN